MFKACEAIATLDMVHLLSYIVRAKELIRHRLQRLRSLLRYTTIVCISISLDTCTDEYSAQPQLTDTLAVEAGRHPIKEKIMKTKFVPNDVYATQQTRFQIITGCNMSGKSTYIRSVALIAIMAQIGC